MSDDDTDDTTSSSSSESRDESQQRPRKKSSTSSGTTSQKRSTASGPKSSTATSTSRSSSQGSSRTSSTSRGASKPQAEGKQPKSHLGAVDASKKAIEQFSSLTDRSPESVVGVQKNDEGWSVTLEVVEARRIPDTSDLLAEYDVQLDPGGELLSYQRSSRYVRGRAET